MPRIHLNMGSNLSDPLNNINQGVDALRRLLALSSDPDAARTIVVSDPYISDAWGFDSPNRFVNVGINIDSALAPDTLLDLTQQAESVVNTTPHRHDDGSYADRMLDIDIITYGDLTIETDRLTIPHPRAALRQFVIIPYCQLNPNEPIINGLPAKLLGRKRGE